MADVTMKVETTKDEYFERTALRMTKSNNTFDILDSEGNHIARIGILDSIAEALSIDITRGDKYYKNRVMAYDSGKLILDSTLPDTNKVITCFLYKK